MDDSIPTDAMRCIRRLAYSTYAADLLKDDVCRAICPADLERAKAEGRRAVYMSSNAVPLPQRWTAVEEELEYLRLFFRLGVRMMHLTYNRRNMIQRGFTDDQIRGILGLNVLRVAKANWDGRVPD